MDDLNRNEQKLINDETDPSVSTTLFFHLPQMEADHD